MLKNKKGELYAGITEDILQRVKTHNAQRGACFTKNKLPFALVFLEKYNTLPEARKREIQIKKWRRDKKEFLIEKYAAGLKTKQD